ncbi:MAG: hypothetical protein EA411_07180 [Saprospirales bacterium]|nr:MAG: hypothetical protein EA411_07180 [Saprospirales bacterium]
MEGISFIYPAWLIFTCITVGILYGLLHYYGSKQFSDQGPWFKRTLFILRTIGVTLVALLLLGPLLRYFITVEEPPIFIVAADASSSITKGGDSLQMVDIYRQLSELADINPGNVEVEKILFGEEVRYGDPAETNFQDRSTNISELLEYVNNTYDGRNLAGMVIATDGIYNRGSNPVYTPIRHTSPIHFVALGDTSVRRDLMVRRVLHNRIAYLDEHFSVQVDVMARMADGSSSNLNIYAIDPQGGSNLLHTEEITIDRNDFFTTSEVILEAGRPGLNRYVVEVEEIEGELSMENNSREFFVEVLDTRQEILILAKTAHPDLGTIKSILEGYQNYEVDIYNINNWEGDLEDYDLVILHQIPSRAPASRTVLNQAVESDRPLWFILGAQSDINAFNQAQDLLEITGAGGGRFNDVVPLVNRDFNPFSIDEDLYNRFRSFVPLLSPFGEYNPSPNANTLLNQRIGQVETDMPLLTMAESGNRRMGVLAGEGLWKWRLYEFSSFDGTDATADLLQKTAQFLSTREDDRRLRVFTDDNLYNESEAVVFEAEYYNASLERLNEPDVMLSITDQDDTQFDYTFDRRGDHYILTTGPFSPGEYTYEAEVEVGMERFTAEGAFTVRPLQLEALNLEANHGLLRQIADEQGGSVFYPDQLSDLGDMLSDDREFTPIAHSTLRTNLILNLFWICVALLLILFTEWFLRRYYGSY